MNQFRLLQQINVTSAIYMARQFISNGFVAVRAEIDPDNERMAEMVDFLAKPRRLTPAYPVAQLPPIGDICSLVVFSQEMGIMPTLEDAIFINTEFYELVCRQSYQDAAKDATLSYFSSRHNYGGGTGVVPVISIYDYDGDLIGFVAGMHIHYDDRPTILKALKVAFGAESESQ